MARSIPTPSDYDCAGASAEWVDKQIVIDISRRHAFLRHPNLLLGVSLYTAGLANAGADNAPEGLGGMLVVAR